jgi:hypothetical protein
VSINFPNAPTTGQLYPQPAVAGVPVYRWDGTKWTTPTGGGSSIYVGDAPPAGVPDNSLWWESDSGVLYVRYNDGDSSQWVAVTPVANPPAPVLDNDVGRNLLHNPLFNIAQRGAGPWTTFAYTADRWKMLGSADTINVSVVAQSDGGRAQIGDESSRNTFQAGVTGNAGAGAFSALAQSIEGVLRLSGKTVTVSFYAYCATAQKIGVNLLQNFGTGGSPSGSAWVSATGAAVTVGPTWTRYSVTIPIPSAAGKTLGTNGDDNTTLWLWLSSGATNNAVAGNIGVQSAVSNFWGIQLEVGSVTSPLEKRDPQQDLTKCQRFYEVATQGLFSGSVSSGSTYASITRFRVSKPFTPTITYGDIYNSGFPAGVPTTNTVNNDMLVCQKVANATTAAGMFSYSLAVSADL